MTVDHVGLREAVLLDERSAALDSHLVACSECAGLVRTLDWVGRAAAGLAPPPPPGLTERVLVRVEAERAGAAVGARSVGRVPARWRLLVAAAAALLLVTTAVVARFQGGGSQSPSSRQIVLAAASRTLARQTARLQVDVTATVDATLAGHDVARLTGDGDIAFPDKARLAYTIHFVAGRGSDSTGERLVIGNRAWERSPGATTWQPSTVGNSLSGRLVFNPAQAVEALRAGAGPPVALGDQTVNGAVLRRYRFLAPASFFSPMFPPALGGAAGPWTVVAGVGSDGLLRQLEIDGNGTSDNDRLDMAPAARRRPVRLRPVGHHHPAVRLGRFRRFACWPPTMLRAYRVGFTGPRPASPQLLIARSGLGLLCGPQRGPCRRC